MNDAKRHLRMSNLCHLMATGFGIGLSPIMPGTIGSFSAIVFWLLLPPVIWVHNLILVMLSICFGVYFCHKTEKDMQVHDHESIVLDEFVGMWIALMSLPVNNLEWVVVSFIIFRLLDIEKPWPIHWLDRNMKGGLGIMIDDIVAGIVSATIIFLMGRYYYRA